MPRYKFLLLLSFLFLTINLSFAQRNKTEKRAIIYSVDGSVFIGEIIGEDKFTIQLLAVTLDTLHINKAFIKRMRRGDENILIHPGGKYHFTKGLFYSLQVGGGLTGDGDDSSQIDFILGNRFNKKISAGLGTGFYYNSAVFRGVWAETNFTPVYAYGRYYPFDTKRRPFVYSKIGWGFPDRNSFGDDHKGGFLFQPGIGIHFASRKNSRFMISLSQYFQNTRGEDFNLDPFGNPIVSKFSLWYNRTVLKFAIEWK